MDKSLEQSYVATVPQRWKSKAQADNHLQCQLMVSTFRTWDLSSRTSIKKKKRRKKHKPLQKLKFLSLRFHSLHLQRWKFSSLPATAALLFLKATLYGSLPWWSWRVGSAPWANRRDRTPMWPSWRTFASIFVYPISTCADTARGEAPWQHCWFTSAPAVSKMSAMCRWPWLSKDQYFVDDDDADDDEVALIVKRSVWWWWWWYIYIMMQFCLSVTKNEHFLLGVSFNHP